MRRVQARFPDELVVIGVHSPKFDTEKETAALAAAVARHGIEHPVVNDADFAIWKAYGARAWPTVVLIDPQGYVLAQQAGEVQADELIGQLEGWIAEYREARALSSEPMPRALAVHRTAPAPAGPLAFPAKVTVDGERVFVADTDHHRVVELRLAAGETTATLVRAFGGGEAGLVDGAGEVARFHRPHGLSVRGETLYVADTENHALRAVDLRDGEVRTLAGTGELARHFLPPRQGMDPLETALRSPWDVLAVEDVLFVAMAGSHQIWVLMEERELLILAGNGREALVDGAVAEASFNQPSGLAFARGHLFVADAEASAVRAVSLDEQAKVMTLVGQGLFEFGDVDGRGDEVRLQHATGIAWLEPYLFLADTYNNKIKRLSLTDGEVRTLAGSGAMGAADGEGAAATFFGPEGLAPSGAGERGALIVADTNNHALRRVDAATGRVDTITIVGG